MEVLQPTYIYVDQQEADSGASFSQLGKRYCEICYQPSRLGEYFVSEESATNARIRDADGTSLGSARKRHYIVAGVRTRRVFSPGLQY
jgi:hypothetical protein